MITFLADLLLIALSIRNVVSHSVIYAKTPKLFLFWKIVYSLLVTRVDFACPAADNFLSAFFSKQI